MSAGKGRSLSAEEHKRRALDGLEPAQDDQGGTITPSPGQQWSDAADRVIATTMRAPHTLAERIAEAVEIEHMPRGPARRLWGLISDRITAGEAVDKEAMLGCASGPEPEDFGGQTKILDLARLDVVLPSAPSYVRSLLEIAINDQIDRERKRRDSRPTKQQALMTLLVELPSVMAEDALARHGLRRADTMTEKAIEWAWEGRMAKGSLTLLAGFGGVGKGLLAVRITADVTRGRAFPGEPEGTRHEPATVAFISMEDSGADTILPRLRLAGAEMSKVFVWGVEEDARELSLPSRVDAVCRWIEEHHPAFVILDPITSFFDKEIDMNRDADVRRALRPILQLASEIGFVILGIIHLKKAGNGVGPSSEPSFHKILGSVGLPNVARTAMLFTRIPGEGRRGSDRALVFDKLNLGPDDVPAIKICLKGYDGEDHPSAEWGGDLDLSADRLFDGPAPPVETLGPAVQDATDFLLGELEDGPRASTVLKASADQAGHSWDSCKRAKQALKGRIVARQSSGVWLWELAGEESAG